MRRFVTLFVLLLSTVPFGVSISGCNRGNAAPTFCNGGDSGMTTTQAATITLQPVVYGVSLNYAEIGQLQGPTTTDCKGSSVGILAYTYGTTDMTIADVQPTTGRLCAGTWNRNSGGGIPDFTYCTPTNKSGVAYVTASANGVTSNPLPVFVHPVVTSIVLGGPSSNCATDPTTACCPLATAGAVTAPPYLANSCISQGSTAQLVARVYAGTGANQTNISCLAGHLQLSAQGETSTTAISQVVNIDQNGVATANQPGSVLISANIANAASSAGIFSTCPPASITLTTPGSTANPVVVNQNNPQPIVATAIDTNGVTLTGLSLEYVSTEPTTITAAAPVTPTLAGAASISAVCQPPSCNPSAYNQIGLFGNGKPVTSNSVNVSVPGTNSTVLYMASTQSQYMVQIDFTTSVLGQPFLLPYVPNSMVISNDGSNIYLGSATALMVVNAVNTLSITRTDPSSPGAVLAISPNGNTLVLSDPVRQIISLENSTGGVISTYGGVATHAEFAPDSQTVYITAGNQLLVYSANTGWTNIVPATSAGTPVTDVAVTVPAVGAYFAGPTTTARSYCSISTPTTPTNEANVFYPPADSSPAITDRLAATNDGMHVLGATATTPTPTLSDLRVSIPAGNMNGATISVACPHAGTMSFSNTLTTTPLSPVTATAITGVWPTSDSTLAFVTYTGSGGVLPAYAPAASGPGTTTYIKLSGSATAPIAGVVSADNSTFYAATSGDNLVHLIKPGTTPGQWIDSSTLAPNLTTPAGAVVPVNLMVQKPRKTT
jgi:trimeric autotransporter adhesin